VHADLRSPKHLAQHKTAKPEEDLPGLGQWYCIECAKWFEGENSLLTHRKGKNHKRRIKFLQEEPYSQKEAEAAAGIGSYNGAAPQVRVTRSNASKAAQEQMEVEAS
jgi:bud site selection protein 20